MTTLSHLSSRRHLARLLLAPFKPRPQDLLARSDLPDYLKRDIGLLDGDSAV